MSVLPMRNASMHHLNIAALLLCAATAGCSMFGKKAPATPAADAKPAAAANANAAPAAAKPLLAAPAAASTNVPIDSIAVIVNDDVITRQELAARVKTVAGRMQAQHVPIPEAADLQRQILAHDHRARPAAGSRGDGRAGRRQHARPRRRPHRRAAKDDHPAAARLYREGGHALRRLDRKSTR